VAAALFGLACNETKTPTEPAGQVTPAPTAIPQPASMSGAVFSSYEEVLAGLTVECQGRSAITSSSGTYSLTGLMSGKTIVTVHFSTKDSDSDDFPITLKPGSNTVDLLAY
jgi:hypothetical protein